MTEWVVRQVEPDGTLVLGFVFHQERPEIGDQIVAGRNSLPGDTGRVQGNRFSATRDDILVRWGDMAPIYHPWRKEARYGRPLS